MAVRCVEGYREHMRDFAQMSVMERWYEHVSAAVRENVEAAGCSGSEVRKQKHEN